MSFLKFPTNAFRCRRGQQRQREVQNNCSGTGVCRSQQLLKGVTTNGVASYITKHSTMIQTIYIQIFSNYTFSSMWNEDRKKRIILK